LDTVRVRISRQIPVFVGVCLALVVRLTQLSQVSIHATTSYGAGRVENGCLNDARLR
jgi:hypothetical protein